MQTRYKKQTSGFPRLTCYVEGCKRTTTRIPPNPDGSLREFICGEHWKRIPLNWRKRLRKANRLQKKAMKEGRPEAARSLQMTINRIWERIDKMWHDEVLNEEGLPVEMAEELRKLGL